MMIEDSTRTYDLVGISGSLRTGSHHSAMLGQISSRLSPGVVLTVVRIDDVPFFDRDVELLGWPGPVARLRDRVAAADALVIASPEYNHSVTGVLKNAIDWLSRRPDSPLDAKPVAIVGGGARGGGRNSQRHLREILQHNKVELLETPEVAVVRVYEAFDKDGAVVDEALSALLDDFTSALERSVRDHGHRPTSERS